MSKRMTLKYGEKSIEACFNIPKTEGSEVPYGIILTHGAGGDMNLSQLTLLAEYLASKGIVVVRFTCKGLNLVYRVKVYEQILWKQRRNVREKYFYGSVDKCCCRFGKRRVLDHALKVKGMKEGDVVEKMGQFVVDWCNRMMKVEIQDRNDSIKARESTKTNGKRKEDGGSSTLRSKRQKTEKK